jgi:hypothetical protein
VAGEEIREHGDHDVDEHDARDVRDVSVEFADRYRALFRKGGLDHVVKRAEPVVDRDTDLHAVVGREDDEGGAEDGPARPRMRRVGHPERGEDRDDHGVVDVEPQEGRETRKRMSR